MKKFKLRLNKETVENLNVSELKNIKAGAVEDAYLELFGSRLFCSSNYEGSCRKSKSCTAPICIPF
ncbi:class I lanthipeptide [Bacteroides acidifaciens]|uniref:class I lanthipeptide n=1 Tax=Bacteroides acidifaciens TaxID=85831 RepID=UPI002578CB9F|nr:class I lanthipeptide [Bacteroides acidifaciens]